MVLASIWPRSRRRLMFYAGVLIVMVGTFHVLNDSRHDVPLPTMTTDGVDYGGGGDDGYVDAASSSALPSATSGDTTNADADVADADAAVVAQAQPVNPCASLGAGMEDVFVIVRTGSNELRQKLPALLNTTVPCFRHYGIWSDLAEEFAGQTISDALDEVDADLVAEHADFEYYRQLRAHGRESEAEGWVDAPNTNFGRDTPAWKLDKWKFLPAAEKAYRRSPDSKWFVFVECDTYILWGSLLAYLATLDDDGAMYVSASSRLYYIGRQMNIGGESFAYGGAGFMISNAAMAAMVARRQADVKRYNDLTIHQWAGDYILSRVMLDAGVELSQIWPTLEGEKPAMLNMRSKSTQGHWLWCYYAASYHHMDPQDHYDYYEFDRAWDWATGPPRHGDVFRHMVAPHMMTDEPRADWDNLSEDSPTPASTFEECRLICQSQPDCVQFSLTGGRTCKTSQDAKLGKHKPPPATPPSPQKQKQTMGNGGGGGGTKNEEEEEEKIEKREEEAGGGERVESGWLMSRVEAWMKETEAACEGEGWIMP